MAMDGQETSEKLTFANSHGGMLAADALGPQDGRLAILLHGGGQTRRSWRPTQAKLAQEGFRAITVDQRGHGESVWDPEGRYLLRYFADDLAGILHQLGDRPAILIGASLGGITSLYALGYHLLPKGSALILVDVVHRPDSEGAGEVRSFMTASGNEGFATLEEAADSIAAYLPHRKRPRNLSGLQHNLRQGSDGRWRWHWDPAFMARADGGAANADLLAECARRIKDPILLVRGEKSEIVTENLAEEFLQLQPKAEYAVVPGARHMVSGDDNDAFTRTILDFIEKNVPAK